MCKEVTLPKCCGRQLLITFQSEYIIIKNMHTNINITLSCEVCGHEVTVKGDLDFAILLWKKRFKEGGVNAD